MTRVRVDCQVETAGNIAGCVELLHLAPIFVKDCWTQTALPIDKHSTEAWSHYFLAKPRYLGGEIVPKKASDDRRQASQRSRPVIEAQLNDGQAPTAPPTFVSLSGLGNRPNKVQSRPRAVRPTVLPRPFDRVAGHCQSLTIIENHR